MGSRGDGNRASESTERHPEASAAAERETGGVRGRYGRYDPNPVLNRLDLRGHQGGFGDVLPRPRLDGEGPVAVVRSILAEVRDRGDEALRDLTARFDGVELESLRVTETEIERAESEVGPEVRSALQEAHAAIYEFHASEVRERHTWNREGVSVTGWNQPVDRAGVYVPGGLAVYPSTVLMSAVPARAAGVPEVVMCVPPAADGSVPAPCLVAARTAGVAEIYKVGGAQAIGALAYGTETVTPVDVIAGPGNRYVAIAKREVAGVVGVPSAFAGPSEIVVIADGTVPDTSAAIDVIVQAEHGPDGLAWLVTWEPEVADAVCDRIAEMVAASNRSESIRATLAEGGYAVLVDGPEQAVGVANAVAPEHLELMCAEPRSLLPLVRHAGAVFLGPWSPASIGDYVAGPSHVLPTMSTARFSGALTVDDFQKRMHAIEVSEEAFDRLAPIVATLARVEGLEAHAASVADRRSWAREGFRP